MADVPTRANWQALKTQHGVPDGAAKGINLGEVLDRFHKDYNRANTHKDMRKALEAVEQSLASYLKKIDRHAVRDYAHFEKAFLDHYLAVAHKNAEDMKRTQATIEVYAKELATLFAMAAKLKTAGATKVEVEAFKAGPLRGASAVGSRVHGVDVHGIDAILGPLADAVDDLELNPAQDVLDALVARIHTGMRGALQIAKQQGIL
jgi:hypothetical protein